MCTKGRDVISASWWLTLTRNSSFKTNNYNHLSPSRLTFIRLPRHLCQGDKLVELVSVARVQPRTSKGITDLLSPRASFCWKQIVPLRSRPRYTPQKRRKQGSFNRHTQKWYISGLVSRSRSRSLSKLIRQITPPTKNGHAPPFIESRKSSQSVNPYYVWTWWVFPCWVKLSRRLHSWWCPSVNSFKFQPCDHTPPGTQRLNGFPWGADEVIKN